jgi:hypothetical protein
VIFLTPRPPLHPVAKGRKTAIKSPSLTRLERGI